MKPCIFWGLMLMAIPGVEAGPFYLSEPAAQASADRIDAVVSAVWKVQQQKFAFFPLPGLPGPVDEAAFLRRCTIDLAGRAPTVEEIKAFLTDVSPDKKDRLINRLLLSEEAQSNQFYYWAEALRLKLPQDRGPTPGWVEWLEEQIVRDRPWNELAAELIRDRSHPGKPSYQALGGDTQDLLRVASDVAGVFLGADLQCARCHNHPFNSYTQSQALALAACFVEPGDSPVRAPPSYLYADMKPGQEVTPRYLPLDTMTAENPASVPTAGPVPGRPRSEQLALWVQETAALRLAQAAGLRLWLRLMGPSQWRSIHQEGTLDMEPWATVIARHGCDLAPGIWSAGGFFTLMERPSEVGEIIHVLGQEFARAGFRERDFLRVLSRTQAYRRQTIELPVPGLRLLPPAPELRRVPPHVTWNTWARMAGSAAFPPPLLNVSGQSHYALLLLGQGKREWTDESMPAISHQLAALFINGAEVQRVATNVSTLFANEPLTGQVEGAFLSTLGRYPAAAELKAAMGHLREQPTSGLQDIAWALLNTAEFLFVP